LLTGTSWECCLEPLEITHESVGYAQEVWDQLVALNGGDPKKAQEIVFKWMVGHEIAENLVANFDRKNIDIVEEFKNKYSGKENAITERVNEKTEYDTFRQIFCDALSAYFFFPELTSDYDRFFNFNLPAFLSQFPEPTPTP
jgi:hypothetical protein